MNASDAEHFVFFFSFQDNSYISNVIRDIRCSRNKTSSAVAF